MIRLFGGDPWPRRAMRMHLALLPSSMATAYLFMRFRRAGLGLDLASRRRSRKVFLKRRAPGWGAMLRLALQESLERRRWQVALGVIGVAWGVGWGLAELARGLL